MGMPKADRYVPRNRVADAPDSILWEAYDQVLNRQVVLEVLRDELLADPAAVERFHRRRRDAARVSGVSGPRVLDGGESARTGAPFIVFAWPLEAAPVPRASTRAQHPPVRRWSFARPLALLLGVLLVAGSAFWIGQTVLLGPPEVRVPDSLRLPKPVAAEPTTLAAVVAATAVPPVARPTSVPASPTPAGERRRIVNTDGQGVALRESPDGPRLPGKGYDEGVTVAVLERNGRWAHIRGDDGREGWILAVTVPP